MRSNVLIPLNYVLVAIERTLLSAMRLGAEGRTHHARAPGRDGAACRSTPSVAAESPPRAARATRPACAVPLGGECPYFCIAYRLSNVYIEHDQLVTLGSTCKRMHSVVHVTTVI